MNYPTFLPGTPGASSTAAAWPSAASTVNQPFKVGGGTSHTTNQPEDNWRQWARQLGLSTPGIVPNPSYIPFPTQDALSPAQPAPETQPPNTSRTVVGNVTLTGNCDDELNRTEALLNRIACTVGSPVLQNIELDIDPTMGPIDSQSGMGNQAAYTTTRDASNGKIHKEVMHINSQFIEYLSHQTPERAEAYLAAVLFHEASHRSVLEAAEQDGQFHPITQADEHNANTRAKAAIAKHYPASLSWLQQHYFTPFDQHFTQAYGGLPLDDPAGGAAICKGNAEFNRCFLK